MTKKRGNNQGFTLLELLVAAAILAIIIIPLLSAFLTTTTVTAKAKKEQRATTAGTNVMERIKSDGVENALKYDGAVKNDDGTYTYTTVENIDGKDFTVEATFDPNSTTSSTSEADKNLDKDEATDYNRESIPQIYSMNSKYDATYTQSNDLDSQMAIKLRDKLNNNSYWPWQDRISEQEVLNNMTKEIVVTIKADGNKTSIDVVVTYSCYDKSNKRKEVQGTENQYIYTDSNKDSQLRNIYLFYNPLYTAAGNSEVRDTITIKNEKLLPVNVFVIRQNEQPAKENNYSVNVQCLEENRENADIVKDENIVTLTQVRSNVDTNLAYSKKNKEPYVEQLMIGSKVCTAEELLSYSDLMGSILVERVYNVTVNVYENKGEDVGHESLITLTTTMQKE